LRNMVNRILESKGEEKAREKNLYLAGEGRLFLTQLQDQMKKKKKAKKRQRMRKGETKTL